MSCVGSFSVWRISWHRRIHLARPHSGSCQHLSALSALVSIVCYAEILAMARFKMSPNQSHSQCPKKSVEVGNKSKMAPALHLARTAITPHQVDCTTQGCVISNPWVQLGCAISNPMLHLLSLLCFPFVKASRMLAATAEQNCVAWSHDASCTQLSMCRRHCWCQCHMRRRCLSGAWLRYK